MGLVHDDASVLHAVSNHEHEILPLSGLKNKRKAIHDPAIPLFVVGTGGVVGRDDLVCRLKERLQRDQGAALLALRGLPGVGKTTLAATLTQDPDVLEFFSDGVLWANLGPNPDVLSHLHRWGALLGLPTVATTRVITVEEWTGVLRPIIGKRQFLIVIDDVWGIEAALACKVSGPHCAYLMTTRFPSIANQFVLDEAIMVPELAEEDGFALLSRLAPEVVASEPLLVRNLVKAVCSLPLALTIMGNYLRKEAYSRQPRRIHAALARLQNPQERLLLTAVYTTSEQSPGLIDNAVSLQTVIEVGDRVLDQQAREALYALSVFPAKPNSFSEEAAIAVSNVPIKVLDVLSDAGFLEGSEQERYTMHQIIADYARMHLKERGAYGRLVKYMTRYIESHQKDYKALAQEHMNILAALQIALKDELYADLINFVAASTVFHEIKGIASEGNQEYLAVAYYSMAREASMGSGRYRRSARTWTKKFVSPGDYWQSSGFRGACMVGCIFHVILRSEYQDYMALS